ncbi:hypothetical protein M2138_001069 [Dysgonomonadaceae bacterium PH5-43]|nr:hypothetical protein [Dysgonomonadaceae bacterium PH5-43]
MKTNILYPFLCLFALVFIFNACDKKQEFTIWGTVEGSKDNDTLYLEHIGLSNISIIDSVLIKSDNFRFKVARPSYPDFYRLRLGNHIINIAVDSIETIKISANANSFATNYNVEGDSGNKNNKIKELVLLQIETKKQYNILSEQFSNKEISPDDFKDKAYKVINYYKETAKEYIDADFESLVAYFALFQQVNNFLIFNPYDKNDNKLFAAIANVWNLYYPESPRAAQLKNLYFTTRPSSREVKTIEPSIVEGTSSKTLYDISLYGINDKEIRLSEVCDNKVTIIDFTAYSLDISPAHNMLLANVYDKYKQKGIEIYQVSFDVDRHKWKNGAVNLPWICVHDPNTVYSQIALTYNISNLPTSFIMNKKGDIVCRIENYHELETELKKHLKE